LRGNDIASSSVCPRISGAKLICLGDYANSRGAADMGLYPDLLPGYVPLLKAASFRTPGVPYQTPLA